MRNIIFFLLLAIPFALNSVRKQAVQNEKTEKYVKTTTVEGFRDAIRLGNHESKGDLKAVLSGNVPEGSPQILFILNNNTDMATWTPSLWWSYEKIKPGQKGC
jgi:hypothetical protein